MSDDNIELQSRKFPWPEKGDQLFLAGDDWWNNACLNYSLNDWEIYINGYKKAADVLVNHIEETHTNQDILIFPIVFVYRQYLELRLKKLIMDCQLLFDEEQKFPKVHNLNKIWFECKTLLEKLEPKIDQGDLEAVDDGIMQFSELDPGSMSFRYPTNKRDEKSIPSEIKSINTRNLSDVMEKLSAFFEAVKMELSVYFDCKQEVERAFEDWS